MDNKLPDITLPVWMNKGEPLTLAHASKTWWGRVREWLTFPLAQIDVDTCDEQLLALLAYQRDVERFPGESLSLFRLRVKYAFANAQDAGCIAGFARIFERLEIGKIQQLERQLQYEWDVILIRINDEQLSRDNTLMMRLVRQYGRTCRRYFFDVVNQAPANIYSGNFSNEIRYWSAKAILRPTSVTATPETIDLAPGESGVIVVSVLPEDAEDRTFTAISSENEKVTVEISGELLLVRGISRGSATITITTNDMALTAEVTVNVVAVTKFVMLVDSPERPMFYALLSEALTLNYGDGVYGRDFSVEPIEGTDYCGIIATRELQADVEYTITVKGSDSVCFYVDEQNGADQLNTLRELVNVSGDRLTMTNFARGAAGLHLIHSGALDDLPFCTSYEYAFRDCTSLMSLPAGLFDYAWNVASFAGIFRGCINMTMLPDGLFKELENAIEFGSAFYGCTGLIVTGKGMFAGCTNATEFGSVFYNCRSITEVPADTFAGCWSASSLRYAFYGTSSIQSVPGDLFSDLLRATDFSYVLSYSGITAIHEDLFFRCRAVDSFRNSFAYCRSLKQVPQGLFSGQVRARYFGSCFTGCTALEQVMDRVFEGCANATEMTYIFSGCTALREVGLHIFNGCDSATAFDYLFSGCTSLENMPFFREADKARGFSYSFYNCSSLKAIPAGAFESRSLVTHFRNTFSGCSSLESVGDRAFKGCSNVTDLSYLFMDCVKLRTLGDEVFDGCVKVTSVNNLFYNCVALEALPADLFSSFVALTGSTVRAFSFCKSIKSIPAGFFDNCLALTALTSTFTACASLSELPRGLLKNNTRLTTVANLFNTCTSLKGVPDDLFETNALISTFDGVFYGAGIETVPANLFWGASSAVDFSYAFRNTPLTEIPAGLFDRSSLATNFYYTFYGCEKLTSVCDGVFDNTQAERLELTFSNCVALSSNLQKMFPLAEYPHITSTRWLFYRTAVTGSGLKLIDALTGVTEPNNRSVTFTLADQLDDYRQIPQEWGGPAL